MLPKFEICIKCRRGYRPSVLDTNGLCDDCWNDYIDDFSSDWTESDWIEFNRADPEPGEHWFYLLDTETKGTQVPTSPSEQQQIDELVEDWMNENTVETKGTQVPTSADRELGGLLELIEANADELINLSLVPGGPCIKSSVLDNSDHILEACSEIRKKLSKKLQ